MGKIGHLFVVATPIGNLGDITFRAVDVLRSVDFIAAEDTRVTNKVLQKYGVSTPIKPYHDFSSAEDREKILSSLLRGDSIALVSDAGTPLVSDPGYKLVNMARTLNIPVDPVPGACAVIAALCVSGLATNSFQFDGFVPAKTLSKNAYFESILFQERSVVLFESKHRILESLISLSEILQSDREVFIAKEITKKFECHFKGSAIECLNWLKADINHIKGEFVIVIAGCGASALSEKRNAAGMRILDILKDRVSLRDAVRIASEISGAKKNVLYDKAIDKKSIS